MINRITNAEFDKAVEVIKFYANPENYFAISFMADAPCGEFSSDFGDDYEHPDMSGPRPGKMARDFLREVLKLDGVDEYALRKANSNE